MPCLSPRLHCKKGYDYEELEYEMLKLLDKRGAQYPAEHNVGHLYEAKPTLRKFYKELIQPIALIQVLVKRRGKNTGRNKPLKCKQDVKCDRLFIISSS